MIEPAVGILEQGMQGLGVVAAVGADRQRHGDLVALAAVAHKGRAGLAQRCVRGAAAHDRQGLGMHLGEQRVGALGVEGFEALQAERTIS